MDSHHVYISAFEFDHIISVVKCDELWLEPGESCRLSGLRLFSRPQDKQSSPGDERVDSYLAHTWQPCTPPPVSVVPHRVETPAEDTFGIYQTHGETRGCEPFVLLLELLPVEPDDSWWLLCRDVGGQTRGAGAERRCLQGTRPLL